VEQSVIRCNNLHHHIKLYENTFCTKQEELDSRCRLSSPLTSYSPVVTLYITTKYARYIKTVYVLSTECMYFVRTSEHSDYFPMHL